MLKSKGIWHKRQPPAQAQVWAATEPGTVDVETRVGPSKHRNAEEMREGDVLLTVADTDTGEIFHQQVIRPAAGLTALQILERDYFRA